MKGKVRILVALFFMQFFICGGGSIPGPVIATIGAALKITDVATLMMITALPTLTLIPTNLLSGALGSKMSKKTLFYIGAVIWVIGGLGPIFIPNIGITLFLVFRAILGIGSGFIFPLGWAMVHDFYEGKAQQSASGIMNSGGTTLTIFLGLTAGILVRVGGWQATFWLHAFAIVPILLMLFLVPNKKPEKAIADKTAAKAAPPHKSTYGYAFLAFLYFVGSSIMLLSVSLFFTQLLTAGGLDPKTAATSAAGPAGLAISLFSVGSIISSILYGKFVGWFSKWTGVIVVGLGVIANLLLFFFPSITVTFVAEFLLGLSLGASSPTIIMGAMGKSYWSAALTSAICLAGLNLGSFISPYVTKFFLALGGGSWPFAFLMSGIVLAIVAVVFVVMAVLPEKKKITTG